MQKSSKSLSSPPEIEQWAIMNQQRALQAKRMQEIKRQLEQDKKIKFKRELDAQVQAKNQGQVNQFESDRMYMQLLMARAQEQKSREDRARQERIQRRKLIEEENLRAMQNSTKNSKIKLDQPQYNLEIGIQSQQLQRQRQKKGLKEMLDTLDLQLREKHREGSRSRQSESRQEVSTSFVKQPVPNPAHSPKYRQDQRTYEVYEQAMKMKRREEEKFYEKITDEASKKIARENQLRALQEKQRKQQLTAQMMSTLQTQIKTRRQSHNPHPPNPEQPSFLHNIFRAHPESYNKAEYSQILKTQAEQDRQRRLHEKYMSQQQYKFNMNQLNKIVDGKFVHQGYVDRTMDSIGAVEIGGGVVGAYGKNTDHIRGEIERLRKRQRSGFYSRMEY